MGTRDYNHETARLTRRYDAAVGWALQYGIKVYGPGGNFKALGELEREVREHEGRGSKDFTDYLAEAIAQREDHR